MLGRAPELSPWAGLGTFKDSVRRISPATTCSEHRGHNGRTIDHAHHQPGVPQVGAITSGSLRQDHHRGNLNSDDGNGGADNNGGTITGDE